jgi:3-oxoacyl-[acyl-carrier-protein] synthase II
MADNDIWVTGVGLVSCAGEGRAANLAALAEPRPAALDEATFAPFTIHPGPALELDKQIPKKGDQRQMEPWQRLGTYAAGLAIDDAGARDLVADMDLIVAAGGGERDIALDDAVLAALAPLPAAEAAVKLNEMLAGGLRPTLFLAQLSNLMAGNISIVQGVTGASRTFMGEEQAGADAVRVAAARMAEGTSPIALVGAAYSAPRWDMLMLYNFGGLLRQGAWAPVLSRGDAPGAVTGTQAAFMVLETAAHARARGAKGLARLGAIVASQSRRTPADSGRHAMEEALARIAPRFPAGRIPVLSTCTGCALPTALERDVLASLKRDMAIRALGSRFGWGVEAAFPGAIALAAMCLSAGTFPVPMEAAEAPYDGTPTDILVSAFAAWRGESLAHVAAIPPGEQP